MATEDERTAAVQHMTLSGQLMAAALAILAIEGGVVVFAAGDRLVGSWFWIAAGLAFVSFIGSIVAGGKGITAAVKSGSGGTWLLTKGKSCYNAQAGLCFLGLLAFGATCLLTGDAMETDAQKATAAVQASLLDLTAKVERANLSASQAQHAIDLLEDRHGKSEAALGQYHSALDSMSKQLDQFRQSVASLEKAVSVAGGGK